MRERPSRGHPLHAGLGCRALWVVALALAVLGCGADPAPVGPPKLNLPKWDGDYLVLFPNEISPAALKLTAPTPATRNDRVLWTRSTSSDVIGRAKVIDFGFEKRSGHAEYHVGIEFEDPPLARPRVNQTRWDLVIEPGDRSYGVIKTLDQQIKGFKFIACVKQFAGPDDQVEVHFYLYPDTNDVAQVVSEAVAVDEVQTQ